MKTTSMVMGTMMMMLMSMTITTTKFRKSSIDGDDRLVLDVLVDAADKVVVSPLLSLFHCVDQSEGILCSGVQAAEQCLGVEDGNKIKRRKSKKHRIRRKFKA